MIACLSKKHSDHLPSSLGCFQNVHDRLEYLSRGHTHNLTVQSGDVLSPRAVQLRRDTVLRWDLQNCVDV